MKPPPPPYVGLSIKFAEEAGWLNRDGGLFERGGLLNLAKKKVSVLHKELECSVEKLKYKTFEVMKPRIKNKSEVPACE